MCALAARSAPVPDHQEVHSCAPYTASRRCRTRPAIFALLFLIWLCGSLGVQAQTGPARQWGMSDSGIGHVVGRADSGGWSANVAQDGVGVMQYGPYTTQTLAGAQTAFWSLLIDNNTATGDAGPVLELQVQDATRNFTLLAVHDVSRHDFTAAYQYQTFALPFTLPAADAGDKMEFRVVWNKRAYIREQTVSLLGPPTALAATPGSGQVGLTWTAVAGATGTNVYRATVSGGPYAKITVSPVTGTTYTDSGVTGGTQYFYVVTAVTPGGESGYSNQGSAKLAAPGPTVATPASASPNPVPGTTTALSVLGADAAGEGTLTYTWAATGTPPAPVTFSANGTNAAKNTAATFSKAGSYSFAVTLRDGGGLTATSTVTVVVQQTAASVIVSPASATVAPGGTVQFSATVNDQFGNTLSTQPPVTWQSTSGATFSPAIGASSTYTAPLNTGTDTVTATTGMVIGKAVVTIASVPVSLSDVSLGNVGIPAGSNGVGTIDLNETTSSAFTVNLTSSDPALTVQTTVTIAPGQSSIQFGYTANAVINDTDVTITASPVAGGAPQAATIQVFPAIGLDVAATGIDNTGAGKVTLFWIGVSGVTGYNVYRSMSSTGPFTLLASNVSTAGPGPVLMPTFMYTDTGLTLGTQYFYYVTAVQNNVEGVKSNTDSDTTSSSAVPWDTGDASRIITTVNANATAAQPADPADPDAVPLPVGVLTVVAPDGTIYLGNLPDGSPPEVLPADLLTTPRMVRSKDLTVLCLPYLTIRQPQSRHLWRWNLWQLV